MSSVRKRGNKCYTRSNKSGATYVVCDDAPNGSKGQAGVYKAKNPTGKQDGRTKKKEAEIDKQRAFNRVRKSMMSETYQNYYGTVVAPDGIGRYQVSKRGNKQKALIVPKSAPATSTMKRDILNGRIKKDPKLLDGMGKKYIYTRWANDTFEGRRFIDFSPEEGRGKIKKPPPFAGVDRDADIKKAAKTILSGKNPDKKSGQKIDFEAKEIDKFPTKQEARDYESGKMKGAEVRRAMVERTLRYKHYLELAGERVPDWVKDISD
tara:strand:- start:1275 stop:2066 length:792 start_codon:yes stop_codon:yes gene_type:complete